MAKKQEPVRRGKPTTQQTTAAAVVLVCGCMLGAQLDNYWVLLATAVTFVLILLPKNRH